jgi:hypothetical protein
LANWVASVTPATLATPVFVRVLLSGPAGFVGQRLAVGLLAVGGLRAGRSTRAGEFG